MGLEAHVPSPLELAPSTLHCKMVVHALQLRIEVNLASADLSRTIVFVAKLLSVICATYTKLSNCKLIIHKGE